MGSSSESSCPMESSTCSSETGKSKMKRKAQDELPRSWKSLRKAVGGDPSDMGILQRVDSFDTFLLKCTSMTRSSYKPKVFNEHAGVQYFRPDGWWQFQVTPWCLLNGTGMPSDKSMVDFQEINDWPVAYHGTSSDHLAPILQSGLRKPGETPLAKLAHGGAGAGPDGSVYLSPSLWYASHPVYSPLKQIGREQWVQAVLKLRARPGSYRVQRGTLGDKYWPSDLKMDPNFRGNHGLEWLFDRSMLTRCDYVIVGIMLREVGARAHEETFGSCPSLSSGCEGPEYEWTKVLRKRLEDGDFNIDDTESETYMDPSPTYCSDTSTETDTETPTTGLDTELVTCDCTEDVCSLDHGEGLRDTKRIITRETSLRSPDNLDMPGVLAAEHMLILAVTKALASAEWSPGTLKALEPKMADMVKTCLMRGQGPRSDKDSAANYDKVLEAIRTHACDTSQPLRLDDLLEWHGICLQGIHPECGKLRARNVKCGDYPRLQPALIPHACGEFIEAANSLLRRCDLSGSAKAAWCFYHLCRIHPFRDGNGRISRLLAIWALARHGLPWCFCLVPLFTDDEGSTSRAHYIAAIKKGQVGDGCMGADTRALSGHVCSCLLAALRECRAFPPGYVLDLPNLGLASNGCAPLEDDDTDDTT